MSTTEILADIFRDNTAPIIFRRRPEVIPGDLRVSWRLSVLCLVLDKFHGGKSRHEHLHMIWWAIRNESNRRLFIRWLSDEKRPDEAIVRFDPSLNVTVDLAAGQSLIETLPSGAVGLTTSGKSLVRVIKLDDQVLPAEKFFLNQIPGKLTQKSLKGVSEWM